MGISFSDDEVLDNLALNQIYTLRQIRIFLAVNKNSLFLLKDCDNIESDPSRIVTVVSIEDYFVHDKSFSDSYLTPAINKKIYTLR